MKKVRNGKAVRSGVSIMVLVALLTVTSKSARSEIVFTISSALAIASVASTMGFYGGKKFGSTPQVIAVPVPVTPTYNPVVDYQSYLLVQQGSIGEGTFAYQENQRQLQVDCEVISSGITTVCNQNQVPAIY